jgi:hypothetical protein
MGGGAIEGRTDAYIENDGETTLNLGYKANMKTRIEIDLQWLRHVSGGNVVCGAWNTGSLRYCFWHYNGGIQYIFSGKSNGYQAVPGIAADFSRHTAIFDMKNQSLAYVTDGVTNNVAKHSSATFDPTDESVDGMGVFDGIKNGIAQGMTSLARVYSVRIYENDDLKHEFLPYKNGEVVSLRDTVTGYVATKTAKSGVSDPAWPTISGKGVDGEERWVKELPAAATVPVYGSTTLTAAAVGAKSYVWKKDGVVIDGETGESITVDWERKGYKAPATYSCTAVYEVFGVETQGVPVETTVSHIPLGMSILIR